MRYLIFVVLLFFVRTLFAQQAANFMFAEQQFKGIEIYDVIQDDDFNYYFATNDGLFKYNFVEFERIESPDAKSNSVFNLTKDATGTIYCTNMNRQIFIVKNDVCRIFYELKPEEAGPDIYLQVNNEDELLISSRVIIVLNKEGKLLFRRNFPTKYIGPPILLPSGEVQFHVGYSSTVFRYKGQKLIAVNLNKSADVFKFIYLKDKIFAVDLKSKKLYRFETQKSQLVEIPSNELFTRTQSVRFYEMKNGLWLAGTLPGVFYLNKDITSNKQQAFFENYFISDVYVDHEGNTLLSTFDKGIIVIPDLKIPDVFKTFQEDPITTLLPFSENQLILGSSRGLLQNLEGGNLETLNSTGKRPIETMVGNGRFLVFDDGFIRCIDTNTGKIFDLFEASLKAGVWIGENRFLLGTNVGVLECEIQEGGKFLLKRWNELKARVHSMAFDEVNQQVYISTADGLYTNRKEGGLKRLLYKKNDLFPLDIACDRGLLYVAARENGILIYDKGKFIKKLEVELEAKYLVLKKILFANNQLFASTGNGLYLLNEKGKVLRQIDKEFGFSSRRIIDFAFHQSTLWVSHSGGVQEVNLTKKMGTNFNQNLRFERVLVNKERVKMNGSNVFSSRQNSFSFVYSMPSINNRDLIQYQFRLLGADSAWNVNQAGINNVNYNALSPGKYEFQVRIKCQGKYGKILRYSFVIESPFYVRWWFIVLSFGLFFYLVYWYYNRQLAIQKRKSDLINELNASKLTAIQSQMNPHFIFNSLNSIQDLILKKDVQQSYTYITTFSNLVRRTLSYSEKDFISFEQEIKLLELYLSLEKLRFKQGLNYEVIYDEIDDILVPPLLVQPFVENALVHGLLHQEGDKKLSIRFELRDLLICTIEDNGIGREEARKIRERQRGDHESFSSEAIKRRFEILSKVFDGEFGFEFIDLEENGVAKGTRVVLKIPFKRKF